MKYDQFVKDPANYQIFDLVSTKQLNFGFSATDTIAVGTKSLAIHIDYSFEIRQWTIIANPDGPAGSIVIDVWVGDYADGIPTDADSITSGFEPALVNGHTATSDDLTGWGSTIINPNQIIVCNVDSCTDLTDVTFVLTGVRRW